MIEVPEVWQRILFEYDNAPSRRVTLRIAQANPDVAEYLASQPDAPLDLLEDLADVVDPEIIARAPNASIELLGRAGVKAPQAVLENPALLLFSLESPERFQALLGSMVDGLLRLPDPPPAVFKVQFLQNRDTAKRALVHPCVPQDVVVELAGHPYDPSIRQAAASHPLLPRCFAALIGDESLLYYGSSSQLDLMKRFELTEAELLALSEGPQWFQEILADSKSLPPAVSTRLSYSPSLTVQQRLAANPTTPGDVLRNLSGSTDPSLQLSLSMHHACPPDVLEDFAARSLCIPQLINNPNLPAQTRDKLIQKAISAYQSNNDPRGLIQVLVREDIPVSLLEVYAVDANKDIRAAVARNVSTPARFVAPFVSDKALEVRCAVASRKDLTEEVIVRLAGDRAFKVRAALAMNPAISQEIMTRLSSDDKVAVRAALARNHNLARVLISKLAKDDAKEVVSEVSRIHAKFLRR